MLYAPGLATRVWIGSSCGMKSALSPPSVSTCGSDHIQHCPAAACFDCSRNDVALRRFTLVSSAVHSPRTRAEPAGESAALCDAGSAWADARSERLIV